MRRLSNFRFPPECEIPQWRGVVRLRTFSNALFSRGMSCVERDRRVELKLFSFRANGEHLLPAGGSMVKHQDGTMGWVRPSSLGVNETWANAIQNLIASLGGEEAVSSLIDTLTPDRKIIAISVPFGSPYQENNGLTADTIQILARLNLDFDVYPLDFDPRNPSHLAPDLC